MPDLPKPTEPVIPYLTVSDATAAIEFYEKAFGAECTFKLPSEDDDRLMHATLRIGEHIIHLSDDFADFGGTPAPKDNNSSVSMNMSYAKAAHVDMMHDQAISLGASTLSELDDTFWGDRFCLIMDPFGHRWMLRAPLDK